MLAPPLARCPVLRAVLALVALVAVWTGAASGGSPEAAARLILGDDASTPLRLWLAGFAAEGLEAERVAIERDTAVLGFSETCRLEVRRARQPTCQAASELGRDVHGCWIGEGCPDAARREAIVAAAGPLDLPWRVAMRDVADSLPARAAARSRSKALEAAIQLGDDEAAIELANAFADDTSLSPGTRLEALTVLALLGRGHEALERFRRPDFASLPVRIRVGLPVLLLNGPLIGIEGVRATLVPLEACGVVSVARGLRRGGRLESAARVSQAIRRSDPACWDAVVLELDGFHAAGRRREVHEALAEVEDRFATDHPFLALRARVGDLPWLEANLDRVVGWFDVPEHEVDAVRALAAVPHRAHEDPESAARIMARLAAEASAPGSNAPRRAAAALAAIAAWRGDGADPAMPELLAGVEPPYRQWPAVLAEEVLQLVDAGELERARSSLATLEAAHPVHTATLRAAIEVHRLRDFAAGLRAVGRLSRVYDRAHGHSAGGWRWLEEARDALARCRARAPADGVCPGPFRRGPRAAEKTGSEARRKQLHAPPRSPPGASEPGDHGGLR